MSDLSVKISKKEQIAALLQLGVTDVAELATLTHSRPSYIASILRDHKLLDGYFDLYTSSEQPMNVYSKFFSKKLGFKNTATARRSIHYIDTLYGQFARIGDRAGQHHAMLMALTMRNRAAWGGKPREADIFGFWLQQRLTETMSQAETTTAALSPATTMMERGVNQ